MNGLIRVQGAESMGFAAMLDHTANGGVAPVHPCTPISPDVSENEQFSKGEML